MATSAIFPIGGSRVFRCDHCNLARTHVGFVSKVMQVALALQLLLTTTAWALDYVFTTLDYPGAGATTPAGINNRGQVAGTATIAHPSETPPGPGTVETFGFLYSAGTFSRIDYPGARSTFVAAINDSGDIAGTADFSNTDAPSVGFVYRDGAFTPIQVAGALLTEVFGINNPREMVGEYRDSNFQPHAFVYRHGTFQSFAVPGAEYGSPKGINDRGQIVGGYSVPGNSLSLAFFDDSGAFTTLAVPMPPGAGGYATGINNRGQIVGTYAYGGNFGILSTVGFVGTKQVFDSVIVPASQFDTPFGPRTLTSVSGINDHGIITGTWQNGAGGVHGFIGTPSSPTADGGD